MSIMLKRISTCILLTLVFLVPLFFLPITSGFYDFNKNILLLLGVALLLLINPVIKSIVNKQIKITLTPLDLPVLLFALSAIVSFVLQSVNKKEVLIVPGGLGTTLGLALLYFSITQTKIAKKIIIALIASASILGVVASFFFLGWWTAWGVELPTWLGQKFFSPAGGLLPQTMFLGVALILVILKIKTHLKQQENKTPLVYYLLSTVFIALGLGVSLYQLFTVQKPAFLPYTTGWVIAVETFKNWRTALFGVGLTNFLSAFTRFKTFGFNATSAWNLRFANSSNWYLHLLTEIGVLGLVSYLFLVYKVLKTKSSLHVARYALYAIFLIQLFLPSNFLLTFTLFVLLALYASGLPEKKELIEESQILPWLVSMIMIALLGFAGYTFGRAYAAETYFKQSLDALVENRGVDTYNLQIKALNLAPYRTNYRLTYSQTNFALANALAGQENLTDQDRANISQLVQQAIREGKTAASLNPTSVVAWENLAGLYQNLINFAQDADQWTLATYTQAISLDPLNPQLRIALGGVYYGFGNYDEAERLFRVAVDLKPDLANAHYNLAAALRENEKYLPAAQEMQVTLSLVEPETNDFTKVAQELEELRKKIALETPEATPAGELETLAPPAQPPAGIKPPLELEKESAPEIPSPALDEGVEEEAEVSLIPTSSP